MTYSTTLGGVLNRVRRQWQATLRPTVFTLSAPYTAGGSEINLNGDTSQIGEGSIAEVGTSLYYITATTSSGITVLPNWEGATSENAAEGDFAEIDPRIPRSTLADMAEAEIRSWAGQLWRVAHLDLDVTQNERTYELDTTDDVVFLLEQRLEPFGTNIQVSQGPWLWGQSWAGDTWAKAKAKLLRDANTTAFPSGKAIQLETLPTKSTTLHVVYATPFDLSPFTLSTDLVATCGLTVGQIDVLDAGLRHRLLSSGLITRTDWQSAGMSRDSEEVNPLDIIRATDMARAMRDRRLAEEALELRRQWGMT